MDDWVEEPKIYDSETVTPEEMTELQYNLYEEDIDGGLQNIQVSQEELDKQQEELEYAKSFIDIEDSQSAPPYRTDMVHLKFTPEDLVILKEALEAFSTSIEMTDYLYTELEMGNLYQQQQYINMLRDEVNDTLDDYVIHRPYSPFLPTWFKRIGKDAP
jgi:hypothetical protein